MYDSNLEDLIIEDPDGGGERGDYCVVCHHCLLDNDSLTQKTFTAEARNAAGLDSCCSRTIMGTIWFEQYKLDLPPEYRDQIKGPFPTNVNFLFGGGEQKDSLGKYLLPLELHGCSCKMMVELVDSNIPLLISKPSMVRAGIKLDFCDFKTTVFGITKNMEETTIGHPIIKVIPTGSPDLFQDVVLTAEVKQGKVGWKSLTWEEQKKIIHRVHDQVGHPGKTRLIGFLKASSIDWDQQKMKQEVENINNNCERCIMKAKHRRCTDHV